MKITAATAWIPGIPVGLWLAVGARPAGIAVLAISAVLTVHGGLSRGVKL